MNCPARGKLSGHVQWWIVQPGANCLVMSSGELSSQGRIVWSCPVVNCPARGELSGHVQWWSCPGPVLITGRSKLNCNASAALFQIHLPAGRLERGWEPKWGGGGGGGRGGCRRRPCHLRFIFDLVHSNNVTAQNHDHYTWKSVGAVRYVRHEHMHAKTKQTEKKKGAPPPTPIKNKNTRYCPPKTYRKTLVINALKN